ncbi:rhamnan synthesis F family protein [Teichococcus wenyumeiae]|uniref:rhamnan synthesis F family protein n=1 Tax=Teichococcus wenyumeiae TaxID=2478470 RepID=UPI0018F5A64A|nr:rhamnan synthesis F family protein [Pseudoroseomonas wenyumeiae]
MMLPAEVNKLISPASFWKPDYIPQSAWLEHGPFAFWLADTLRPRRFVELGSHYAYSYFAFCQAFQKLGTDTTAYAVDTWQGDEHAGFYDESVYRTVLKQNQDRYSSFSTLMRQTFDKAVAYIDDGSVDLLHIDGRHFYEDVKEDYELWLPKLTPNAIVLFHDTNVRERRFGVWKFFQELAQNHPSFEFKHCNGLGIIAPGLVPDVMQALFTASDNDAAMVRNIYSSLGQSITIKRTLLAREEALHALLDYGDALSSSHAEALAKVADWDGQIQEVLAGMLRASAGRDEATRLLQEATARFEHENALSAAQFEQELVSRTEKMRQELAAAAEHLQQEWKSRTDHLEHQLAVRSDEFHHLQNQLQDAEASRAAAVQDLAETKRALISAEADARRSSQESQHALRNELRNLTAKFVAEQKSHQSERHHLQSILAEREQALGVQTAAIARLEHELRGQAEATHHLTQQLAAIYGSSSWKMMYPLQRILKRSPGLRLIGRRTAKLMWWTATGQVVSRLRRRSSLPGPSASGQMVQAVTRADMPSSIELVSTDIPEAARPIDRDYSLSLPLRYVDSSVAAQEGSVAAIIHLYYADLAVEFRSYLQNIPGEVDLFISARDNFGQQQIERAFDGWDKGKVEVRVVPNRGRDIAPKLVSFKDVYDKYEVVLHLHSKRSRHASVLDRWRYHILENLLGTPKVVSSIFEAFRSNANLGMVAAAHFEPVRHWINWGNNIDQASSLAERMNFSIDKEGVLDFPSGSMFWARSAALRPLLDLDLQTEDFPPEEGQIDGTVAHAIERIYFYVCEKAGYDWAKVARPDLMENTPAIISARDSLSLKQYFQRYTFRLLSPGAEKPRAMPPTPVLAPPQRLLDQIRAHTLGEGRLISPGTRLVVGFVTYNNEDADLRQAVQAATMSLRRAGLPLDGSIMLLDNGTSSEAILPADGNIRRLPSVGNVGFGAGHNLLMREAFAAGSDVYVAVNPDGMLHPDALGCMLRMVQAHANRALVEALQFPMEHPKPYDRETFDTPWLSGACLAIPREAYEVLGGFDDDFFMYCEDVDLSWRARANGFALKTCPAALFLHAVTNRQISKATIKMIYESGVVLARKWGSSSFENWLRSELQGMELQMPAAAPEMVPEEWRSYADFDHHFSFATPRW